MDDLQLKPFQHSRRLKALYWWLLGLLFLVELILFRLAFSNYGEQGLAKCLWAFVASSGLPLGILLRLVVNVRPLVFARYTLFEDRLEVGRGSKLMVLKFEDLDKIKFSVGISRFFRGYKLYHQSGQTVRIFSTLENSDLILRKIQQVRPEFVKDRDLVRYSRLVKLNRVSWERLVELKSRLRLVAINLLAVPLVFSLVTWWTLDISTLLKLDFKWIDWFLLTVLGHFFATLVINAIEEKAVYLFYATAVTSESFTRDFAKEKVIRIIFSALYWALSLGAVIFLITTKNL